MDDQASEVRGRHHAMFMPPGQEQAAGYRMFRKALRRDGFEAGEFLRIGKNGCEPWMRATYTPVHGFGGRVVGMARFATNVTGTRQRAADHEGQMATLDRVRAVVEFALDGTILSTNPGFPLAPGHALHKVQGLGHAMFMPPERSCRQNIHAARRARCTDLPRLPGSAAPRRVPTRWQGRARGLERKPLPGRFDLHRHRKGARPCREARRPFEEIRQADASGFIARMVRSG